MHELRSTVLAGEGSRSSPLIAPKRNRRATDENGPSLVAVTIPRTEARARNERKEERQRDVVDRTLIYFRRQKHEVPVVNVSSGGAMIQTDLLPRIGETIDIQFADCNRTKSVVRWIRDGRIGVEFLEETTILGSAKVRNHVYGNVPDEAPAADADAAVPSQAAAEPEKKRGLSVRERRHGLTWTGTLYWTYEAFSVRVRNISARGAMLEGECALEVGAKVRLNLNEAGTLVGEVRWAEGGNVGVKFDEQFDLRLLSQSRPSAPVFANGFAKAEHNNRKVIPGEFAPPKRRLWKMGF